jgi:hypothetical protein
MRKEEEKKIKYKASSSASSSQKSAENNHSDHLKKVPDALSEQQYPSLLAASDLSHLSQTNRERSKLFKPALALKKLLRLVVRYELDKEKIQVGIKAGVNPILQEVSALLIQHPDLALKRDHITDQSGRKFYCSPLEAAHWSGNWALCHMILVQVQPKESAIKQLREWDAKAYDYDLILMCAEGDTFPLLKKAPALIKQFNGQGEDKIFQWGNMNGKWELTELDNNTAELFVNLNFPDTSIKQPITMISNQITSEMYDALKKGHTVAHFDLGEYVRVTDAFIKKYPANNAVPEALYDECERDSYKIGMARNKMPAWIAAVWCCNTSFDPLPNIRHLIWLPDVYGLKLHDGSDFFKDKLSGVTTMIKGQGLLHGRATIGPGGNVMLLSLTLAIDLAVMADLYKVITEQREKSKKLLFGESKLTPGLSSG